MKTYYIYDYQTDELLGTVLALDILDAEYKACGPFDTYSDLYALSYML